MQEKILVPLDGTQVGEAVLPKLESLVLGTTPGANIEVTLLRVLSQVNFNVLTDDKRAQLPISEEDIKTMKAEAQVYLDKVAKEIKPKCFTVKTMISIGNAAEEIVNAAHATGADLIAMSTHGRSGVVRWAIGSVTDKVMRLEGKIPVLAVKATNKKDGSSVLPMESLQSLVKHP